MGIGVVGINPEGAQIELNGSLALALLLVDVGNVVVRLRMFGLQCDGALVEFEGILDLAQVFQGNRQVVKRFRLRGRQPNRLRVVFDGAVRVSQLAKNKPEAVVGQRIIRFECNGLLAVPGRLAQMALCHEHMGKVVAGLGKLGIQSDGFFVVPPGLSKVAQRPVADPGVVVRLSVVGRPPQRQVVVTDGILVPFLRCQHHPKLVAGFHLIGIQHEGLLKTAIGLFILSDGLLAIGHGAIEHGAVDVHRQSRPARLNSFIRASLSLQRDCQAVVGLRIVCL